MTVNQVPWWITLTVAAIAAAAAIGSAIIANRAASRAKAAEAEALRVRDLEARLASKKYDTYKPMIDMLRDTLLVAKDSDAESPITPAKVGDFSQWISIYGSDEAVMIFHRFMQAAFDKPPSEVSLRLYADFVLAARRDIGVPDSLLGPADILGLRLTDLYRTSRVYGLVTMSFEQLCAAYGWQPPWSRTPEEIKRLDESYSNTDLEAG